MSRSTSTSSAAAQRLSELRHKMHDISDAVDTELASRAAEQSGALSAAREEVLLLEQNVATECRRRADADAAMTQYAEESLGKAAAAAEQSVSVRLGIIEANVEAVTGKVAHLEGDVAKQRSKDEQLLTGLRSISSKMTAHVRQEVERERAARVQFEASLLQNMKTELWRFDETLQVEAQNRERIGEALVSEVKLLAQWTGRREEDRVKGQIVADAKALRAQLAALRSARLETEQSLEGMMQELVAQVDAGVHPAR